MTSRWITALVFVFTSLALNAAPPAKPPAAATPAALPQFKVTSPAFKDYIGYHDVQAAKEAAARITNIYSGIDNKNSALHKHIKGQK